LFHNALDRLTDRPTDRPTDGWREWSVTIGRLRFIESDAA